MTKNDELSLKKIILVGHNLVFRYNIIRKNLRENTMASENFEKFNQTHLTNNFFGQAILRDFLIPDILGEDTSLILYWAGKRLAQQFPLENTADLPLFFQLANWGILTITDAKPNHVTYTLSGKIISSRLSREQKQPVTFQLEAGFIAQTIEQNEHIVAEANATSKNKQTVEILMQSDPNDVVNHQVNSGELVTHRDLVEAKAKYDDNLILRVEQITDAKSENSESQSSQTSTVSEPKTLDQKSTSTDDNDLESGSHSDANQQSQSSVSKSQTDSSSNDFSHVDEELVEDHESAQNGNDVEGSSVEDTSTSIGSAAKQNNYPTPKAPLPTRQELREQKARERWS